MDETEMMEEVRINGAEKAEEKPLEEERAKNSNGDINTAEAVIANVSKSANQNNQKPSQNPQIPQSTRLTIDLSSCCADEENALQYHHSCHSPIEKSGQTTRRARILDRCNVKSPSLVLTPSPSAMASNYHSSITETLEEMKKESGDKFSSITNQGSSVPDPFQFPHRPIEQITLLNSEVELERKSAKRKQTLKSGGDLVNDSFESELNAKRRPISPPEFDKLNFEGENVSGVPNKSFSFLFLPSIFEMRSNMLFIYDYYTAHGYNSALL